MNSGSRSIVSLFFFFFFFKIFLLSRKIWRQYWNLERVFHPVQTSRSDMRKYSSALPHLIALFRSTTSSLMLPQWNRAFLCTVFTEIHHRMQCYPDIEGWYARSTFHPPTPAVLYDVRTTLCSAQTLCVFVCRSTHCVSKQRRRNCRHLFLINLNAGNSASWTEVIYQDFEIFFFLFSCVYIFIRKA